MGVKNKHLKYLTNAKKLYALRFKRLGPHPIEDTQSICEMVICFFYFSKNSFSKNHAYRPSKPPDIYTQTKNLQYITKKKTQTTQTNNSHATKHQT